MGEWRCLPTLRQQGPDSPRRKGSGSPISHFSPQADHPKMNEDSTEYGLVEPFGTDGGSLAGISTEYAFALGVEWHMFRQRLLKTSKPFTIWCLAANAVRLVKMAERHCRFVEERRTGFDGWMEIWVGTRLSESSAPESK